MRVGIGMSLKSKAHGFCFYQRINICAFADWRSDLRLDRLASTLVHDGGFIWEWAYKYKSPLNTPGGMTGGGGVRRSQIQKSWEAVKRLDRLAPNLVHVCGFIWEWI